jgi:hypothetical protein
MGMFWRLTRPSGGAEDVHGRCLLREGFLLAAQQGFQLCLGLIIFP